MFFGEPTVHFFPNFFPLSPLTEVSPQPSTIPGGNPPEGWQSAVGWGDTGFELGTAGQLSFSPVICKKGVEMESPPPGDRPVCSPVFC